MKMLKVFFVVVLFCSPGCAWTVDKVTLNYKFDKPVPSTTWECVKDKTLAIGEFADRRNVKNPNIVIHKKNANGNTCPGGWQAEKPVAEIVKDALATGLRNAGANVVTDDPVYVINGKILRYNFEYIMGFWDADVEPELMVKLSLTNTKSGKILWKDTFIGKGGMKCHWYSEVVTKGFPAALDDLVLQVVTDNYLKQKLMDN
ncbi:MAG: hypothetical protein SVT52_05145 [Planctomycetota bacterium]|nr:hypothetical protein [Planctomycetota bacterium]